MSSPHISVIVPAHNAEHTLRETLKGLAAQRCDFSFEVILADNGSTDGTRDIAQSCAHWFEHFLILTADTHRGAAHARNQGVLAANTSNVAFMDADDVPHTLWLQAICVALQNHSFVASRHDGFKLNSSGQLSCREVPQSEGLQEYTYPKFLPHSGGCGLAIKRHLFLQMNGFDEAWLELEDTEFCWRTQLAGFPLHFAADAVVHIRLRNEHKKSFSQAFRWGRNNVRLYKRFRSQMPTLSWKQGVRWWLYFLGPRYMVSQLKDSSKRLRWLWQVSWRLGRVVGSVRYATWAL